MATLVSPFDRERAEEIRVEASRDRQIFSLGSDASQTLKEAEKLRKRGNELLSKSARGEQQKEALALLKKADDLSAQAKLKLEAQGQLERDCDALLKGFQEGNIASTVAEAQAQEMRGAGQAYASATGKVEQAKADRDEKLRKVKEIDERIAAAKAEVETLEAERARLLKEIDDIDADLKVLEDEQKAAKERRDRLSSFQAGLDSASRKLQAFAAKLDWDLSDGELTQEERVPLEAKRKEVDRALKALEEERKDLGLPAEIPQIDENEPLETIQEWGALSRIVQDLGAVRTEVAREQESEKARFAELQEREVELRETRAVKMAEVEDRNTRIAAGKAYIASEERARERAVQEQAAAERRYEEARQERAYEERRYQEKRDEERRQEARLEETRREQRRLEAQDADRRVAEQRALDARSAAALDRARSLLADAGLGAIAEDFVRYVAAGLSPAAIEAAAHSIVASERARTERTRQEAEERARALALQQARLRLQSVGARIGAEEIAGQIGSASRPADVEQALHGVTASYVARDDARRSREKAADRQELARIA